MQRRLSNVGRLLHASPVEVRHQQAWASSSCLGHRHRRPERLALLSALLFSMVAASLLVFPIPAEGESVGGGRMLLQAEGNASMMLTADLLPEVAYFDASAGLSVSGSGSVKTWRDMEPTRRPNNVLKFTAGCTLQQQPPSEAAAAAAGAAAVTFSGSCLGRMKASLSLTGSTGSRWRKSTEAFTAVWLGRFEADPATTKQALIHLSRTRTDRKHALVWSSNELSISAGDENKEDSNRTTVSAGELLTDNPPPVNEWTMEVLVRKRGAESATYYRAREGDRQLSSWPVSSVPLAIGGDNLVIGGDYRDRNSYMRGQVAAVLLYNRALSADDVTNLAVHFNSRFGLLSGGE
ncbi:hypothetical protein PLESTM_000711400 [Pleodorina starrii]|nr:hypothetical protein PLESTM_000711400 [Pleodorina starrii]